MLLQWWLGDGEAGLEGTPIIAMTDKQKNMNKIDKLNDLAYTPC
jgi:hypothetical protein